MMTSTAEQHKSEYSDAGRCRQRARALRQYDQSVMPPARRRSPPAGWPAGRSLGRPPTRFAVAPADARNSDVRRRWRRRQQQRWRRWLTKGESKKSGQDKVAREPHETRCQHGAWRPPRRAPKSGASASRAIALPPKLRRRLPHITRVHVSSVALRVLACPDSGPRRYASSLDIVVVVARRRCASPPFDWQRKFQYARRSWSAAAKRESCRKRLRRRAHSHDNANQRPRRRFHLLDTRPISGRAEWRWRRRRRHLEQPALEAPPSPPPPLAQKPPPRRSSSADRLQRGRAHSLPLVVVVESRRARRQRAA